MNIRILLSTFVFSVYCQFGHGTLIMQRRDGTVNFNRRWTDYENGFGSPRSNYWIGLRQMKTLADAGNHILRVDLEDLDSNKRTIQYTNFALGPANESYPLYIGGNSFSGSVPDDFSYNNGAPFATFDSPDPDNCAFNHRVGWWYNHCSLALPTGHYYNRGRYTPSRGYYDGIYYRDWLGYGYSLKSIIMVLSKF